MSKDKNEKKSTTKAIIDIGNEEIKNATDADNIIFKECLNIVAGTKEGQFVLNRLMDKCGFLRLSVNPPNKDGADDTVIQYNEGRRSIWLYDLYKYLNVKNLKTILFLNRRLLCSRQVKK